MLQEMLSRGKTAARKLTHARILLKADAAPGGPDWHDDTIAEALEIGRATIERVRKQFVEEGLEAALERRPSRRQYPRKLGGRLASAREQEAPAAKKSGRYDKVKRWTGEKIAEERAYAMNHAKEYFAESSEAYFGRNDFYLFTRTELKEYDPQMYDLFKRLWQCQTEPAAPACSQ